MVVLLVAAVLLFYTFLVAPEVSGHGGRLNWATLALAGLFAVNVSSALLALRVHGRPLIHPRAVSLAVLISFTAGLLAELIKVSGATGINVERVGSGVHWNRVYGGSVIVVVVYLVRLAYRTARRRRMRRPQT